MRKTHFVKSLMLASILPFCSFMMPETDNTTPKEEQQIVLTNASTMGLTPKLSKSPSPPQ